MSSTATFGLALTFDVFKPKQSADGAGVLFMVSGGWFAKVALVAQGRGRADHRHGANWRPDVLMPGP